MSKAVHPNSIIAYHEIDRSDRKKIVLSVYQQRPSEPLTDRQVAEQLGFKDMNAVRPRISEMVAQGVLIECGKAKDYLTRKCVRLTKIFSGEHQLNLF